MRAPARMTLPKRRFLDQVDVIREEPAAEVGSVAFLSRLLVQANLPYREPAEPSFVRRNGALTLTLQAPPQIGLPFGRYPRLLLAWLGTEVVRTRSPELELGESLSATMRDLGITPSGGGHGSFERFRDQMRRLFNTTITYSWDVRRPRGRIQADAGYRLTEAVLWWEPTKEPGGRLRLSEPFFQELLRHPVPVDFRVLRALASPLAIDIYAWLSYRSFTSSSAPVTIPWPELAAQFGTTGSVRKFRENFERAIGAVLAVYPSAAVEMDALGLHVIPGVPHVGARPGRREMP
ncbi:MAG: replication protein RepA [Thermoanaerobaculia bacterium]|nr:replication protein RepA [Thermoanaerobaculia bacterium]